MSGASRRVRGRSRAALPSLLAPLLALLLVAPGAAAQGSAPDYPEEFLALLPRWTSEVEALATESDRDRPWWPEAESYLQKAREATDAKRLRVAMFHLETFSELVLAHQLHDEANETRTSDAERKTLIATRTGTMRQDAERAWEAFRAELHQYDGQARSLHTIEKAVYAADVALVATLAVKDHEVIARDLLKQPDVPLGYTLALVRASHTASLNIGWASDMLAEAAKQEGLPPRVVEEVWENVTAAALTVQEGEPPAYLEPLEDLSMPAKENGEALLSLAFALAEQRAVRAHGMQTMFGDASSRGLDVVRDAARGMNRALNNTTVERPREYGLTAVFTSDAIDRARFTNEFVEAGRADLSMVIVAWSGLDHANVAFAALAQVSPVRPPADEDEETPFVGLAWLVAAVALVAVARSRR